VGDFNGDGIPDLVVSAGGPSQPLVIFLGNANGTYTAVSGPSIFSYSFGPIVVADFNGDGKQDMAVLNANSNTVTILLGNGDGTFNVVPSGAVIGSNANQIAVGDFNGDGIPDLAVTTSSSSSLNILLGNGDGTFTAATSSPVASSSPFAIAVGDFNGDGKLDLAVTDSYNDTISVFLGNGDGTFAAATTLHSGSSGSPIATADFTGDGKLDLAVGVAGASGASDSVTILTGNGDGTFNVPTFSQAASAANISSLQVGDFNADGIPDLALTDKSAGTFTVLLGDGSGSFTATTSILPGNPIFGLSCAEGDLNGDGRTDLVLGVFGSSTALVYLTEPIETATAAASLALTGAGQHQVDASFGGNSNYISSTSGTTMLWGPPLATTTTLTLTSGGSPVSSVTPGTAVTLTATVMAGAVPLTAGKVNFCDATASHCTDIHNVGTATLTSNGTATYKFVPGPGTYSYKAEYVLSGIGAASASTALNLTVGPAPIPVYTDTTSISESGVPGNYSLTATVVGFGGPTAPTGTVSFLDTSYSNTLLGNAVLGSATSGVGWEIGQTPAVGGTAAVAQVTGDFNGDGIPDLAVLWNNNSIDWEGPFSVTILLGNGDGTFTMGPVTQATGVESYPAMIAGDFNGDGKTDLAILSWNGYSTSYITTLLGNGDGTFGTPQTGTVYNQGAVGGDAIPGSMVASDFNGDGKLDLAVVGDYVSSGGVTILLGNGDGTFTSTGLNLAPTQGFGSVATGDFNGDGIPDLVAADYFEPGGATIFLGKGDGTFTPAAAQLPIGTFAKAIAVGDFNGDGFPDLAFGFTGAVEVYLGKGDGTFTQASGSPVYGAGLSLVAGNFSHNGKLDLAGVDNYKGAIDLFLGAGDGTFTESSTVPQLSLGTTGSYGLVSVDFNGDGVPDLAVLPSSSADAATILLTEPTETATATVNSIAPVGAGTHNVEASYQGDSNYPASVSGAVQLTAGLAPLVVTPASGTYSTVQAVTITESIPGATIYYQAYGTVNTNGYVRYTGPIQLTKDGTETILAYATETGYEPANSITENYTINLPVTPTITWATPAPITYGTAIGASQLDATSSVPGTFAYTPAAGTVLNAGSQTLTATFTPTDTTDYTTATATVQLTVNQAIPTITWAAPAAITYGAALTATQLNAGSDGVAGTFAYTPSLGTVLAAGKQTLSVTFTPADAADYSTASAAVSLTVNQASPALALACTEVAYDGNAHSCTGTATGVGGATVSGTWSMSPASETATGSYPVTGTFTSGDANYTSGTASGTLKIDQAMPIITWPAPAAITYGTALGSAQLDASSKVAGTFAYSPAAGTVPAAGKPILSVAFTPTDTNDYAVAMATTNLTVNQATPTITWSTPAAITYGTTLSATQLDATASVPGTFAYSPAAGTTPAVGSDQLSVTFTPTDGTDYTAATATVSLVVSSPSNPTPLFGSMSPAYTAAGGAAFTLTANGSGFVNGSTVYWGTTSLATQFVSATQLTAQVTAAEIASAGTATITVQSPAPGGGSSSTLQFEIDSAGTGSGTAPSFTSAAVSVAAGSTANYPVTLPPSATSVSASCLNLPTGASCSYSASSGAVTITTSSSTPKGTYQVTVVFSEILPGSASAFVILPFLLLPLLFIRRKMAGRGAWFTACIGLILLAGAAAAVGCGGSSSSTVTNPTHQISSSGTVSLTVQ
jgi:hypothetical protein